MDIGHWLVVLVSSAATAFSVAFVVVRRRREARDAIAHRELEARANANALPPTLYPVIDPNVCMGSLSCLKACPEGDILGVVNGVAKLLEPAHCIGHGRCAAECPVNAIKLVFGSAQRGVDLPETSEFFESSRPGVHIVGELGGMGLIKNAITQGVQCVEYLTKQLGSGQRSRDMADVAIVGAGPAGLATAVACRTAGLTFHLLEQDTVGGAVAHYPRQKVVMSSPVELPGYGHISKQFISKEELLATWRDVLKKMRIRVHEGFKVKGIHGEDGAFRVETAEGDVKARKVVLAIGRRGSPRKLEVPGADSAKVSYRLADAQQYESCAVLVVGGGSAAVEAAVQLVEQSSAQVVLVHRGERFDRARPELIEKAEGLASERRLRIFFKTTVAEIRDDAVILDVDGRGKRSLPNDFVIACLGGELPTTFLSKIDVGIHRLYGTTANDPVDAKAPRGSAKEQEQARKDRVFAWALFAMGAAIVVAFLAMGWSYYWLPVRARAASPLHAMLRPSGPVGHGVGIVSTLFLMTNFLYALRKRWRRLKRTGRIKRWLTMHMFIGYLGPPMIAFHAAFQSKNQLATFTAISLAIVVITGIVGRFFYGMVPTDDGKVLELNVIMERWTRLKRRMEPLLKHVKNPEPVRALLEEATTPPKNETMLHFLWRLPRWRITARHRLEALKALFTDENAYDEFHDAFERMQTLRASVTFYKSLRRFFSGWRWIHSGLAVFLALMIVAHIGVELFLGYFWIFQ